MSLEERICGLIEQESNADCRGCVTRPCPLINDLLALIEIEKARGYNEGYNKAANDYNAKIDEPLEDNNAKNNNAI